MILNYVSFALFGSIVGALFCRERYDAVFVFQTSPILMSFPAIFKSKLSRIPLYTWVLDLWPETLLAVDFARATSLGYRIGFSLCRMIYSLSGTLLMPSTSLTMKMRGEGYTHVEYLPQWGEDLFLAVESTRAKSHAPFRIVFAGNIGKAQDVDTIVEAAFLLKGHNIEFFFYGDGSSRPSLEKKVRDKGLVNQVFFLGKKPIDQMPDCFENAGALLVSLTSDPLFSMMIPGKVQAYLASGMPIIAMLEGEGAEIISHHKCGVVCKPGNSKDLARACIEISSLSDEKRLEMGKRSRETYHQKFTKKGVVDTLLNLMGNQ
ncbi:MAG: glycosyltransferase family 4 protein [Bdellovibrionota bacterium]